MNNWNEGIATAGSYYIQQESVLQEKQPIILEVSKNSANIYGSIGWLIFFIGLEMLLLMDMFIHGYKFLLRSVMLTDGHIKYKKVSQIISTNISNICLLIHTHSSNFVNY